MPYLEPKLVIYPIQKQVLTPGLVQMVSMLTLNKLELTEMIQQELVQNPVLEEGTEIMENGEAAEETLELETEGGKDAAEQPVATAVADIDDTDARYAEVSEREVTVEETVDSAPA